MKYYLIAGEASGDLHGSNLIRHIRELDSEAEIRFWGGDLMQKEGGEMVKHYRETAFMGLTDVLKNLGKIRRFIKECKEDILRWKPDALVLIDYPGFNLRIARFGKENGIPVHYYISPKVWAWNRKRAWKIKRDIDHLYTILPFETEFYKPYGVHPDYVGNPLCDAIEHYPFEPQFKESHGLNQPVIALLPGSRMSELKYVLPSMLEVTGSYPGYQFVLAGAAHISEEVYRSYIGSHPVKLIRGCTYDVLNNATAALVCSGTATLETALLNCPQVVCYRFSDLSYRIGKWLVKVKYISLVNLIMDRKVVTELIQHELSKENIIRELSAILEGRERQEMLHSYAALRIKVGGPGASRRTAELVVSRCRSKMQH